MSHPHRHHDRPTLLQAGVRLRLAGAVIVLLLLAWVVHGSLAG